MRKSKKLKGNYIAFGCTHGDLVSEEAFGKLLEFKEQHQPEHVIHLGDAFEFTALQ